MVYRFPYNPCQDQEIVQTFYKLVKTYTLPKLPNVTLKTVHRCLGNKMSNCQAQVHNLKPKSRGLSQTINISCLKVRPNYRSNVQVFSEWDRPRPDRRERGGGWGHSCGDHQRWGLSWSAVHWVRDTRVMNCCEHWHLMQEPETSRGHLWHRDLCGAGPGGGGGGQAAGGEWGRAAHHPGVPHTLKTHLEFILKYVYCHL